MNATTRRHKAGELAHLRTVENAIVDFRQNAAARNNPVLELVLAAASLSEAIRRACASCTTDGKKFRHDQYLRAASVAALEQRLIENLRVLTTAKTFDELHGVIRGLRPKWIGDLKVFDVAMRLGAYLQIDLERSEFVCLHRGGHWRGGKP